MKSLGIDLAGASSRKTGVAVIEGDASPVITEARLQPMAETPGAAEAELLQLIDGVEPDVLAIDAPLTLPPCLTCPNYCRGPDTELCELQAARAMWEAGSNPVSRRLCEVQAKALIPGLDPKPTMGLGIITARAVALVRKLEVRGRPPCSIPRREILEVYPQASFIRLAGRTVALRPKERDEDDEEFCKRATAGLEEIGLELGAGHRQRMRESRDVLDAVVSAYTGWLHSDGLEEPPAAVNVASGWIWFPREA